MKSKNGIANEIYDCDFEELTGGEKASVTKKYTAQKATRAAPRAAKKQVKTSGYSEVTFGRPGVNGTKTCIVPSGTNVADAEKQANTNIDYKKEGFQIKKSTHYSVGQILKTSDVIYDGDLVLICVGIDSA